MFEFGNAMVLLLSAYHSPIQFPLFGIASQEDNPDLISCFSMFPPLNPDSPAML